MKLKSINTVLVSVPKTYEDTIKCGNLQLYLDTRFDNVKHTIRYGEIISSPDKRFIPGDTIYFHHNIVRRISTLSGVEKESPEEILNHTFQVPSNEIYARKRNGTLQAITPYCFIKPIPKKQETIAGIELISKEKYEPNIGIVKYGNEELEKMGVHEGDTVIFTKNSEYQYPIDDELLYRMQNSWLIAVTDGL